MNRSNRGCALLLVGLLVLPATLIAEPAGAQVSVQAPGPGAGASAQAQDEEDTGDWDVIVYPYLWGPNLNVDARVGDVSFADTVTVDELLKNLNFGVMGGVEVQYKHRWFAGIDGFLALLYARTETDPMIKSLGPAVVTNGQVVLTVPSLTAQVGTVHARVDADQFIWLGYLGYRLHSGPVPGFLGGPGPDDKKRIDVDAYVGGRLWYNHVTVNANGPPIFISAGTGSVRFVGRPILDLGGGIKMRIPSATGAPINVHEEKTIWWVDPVIGGRIRMDLSDRYFLRIMGDVGGFDWGDASKFTWQGWAMLGRRVKTNWTIEAGYRGLGIIREKPNSKLDVIYQGPVFGATYRF